MSGLPQGWDARQAPDGRWYFIDLRNNTTTWDDPRQNPSYNMPSSSASVASPPAYPESRAPYGGSPAPAPYPQDRKGPPSYQGSPYGQPAQSPYQQGPQGQMPPAYPYQHQTSPPPPPQQSGYYSPSPYEQPPQQQPPYQQPPYQQQQYQQQYQESYPPQQGQSPYPPQQGQPPQQLPGGSGINKFLQGPNSGMKVAGVAAAGILGGFLIGEVAEHHHDTGRW